MACIAVLVFFALLLVSAAFGYRTIIQIYHGVTLFNRSRLHVSFRNLDQRFTVAEVAAADEVFVLKEDIRALPDEYIYLN